MPTAHHEDEPRVTPVVDGLRSSGHADGPAPEVLGHLANVHDGAHPAGEGLRTDGLVDAVFLAGLQGAPDSVTVMKCGTRGAREVGLDCSNRTDLLLHIHRNGERDGEDRELELFRAKVLKHELAGPRVTAKCAADELGAVGRTGPGGDTPQGPGLESELVESELVVVGSGQPILDDD